LDEQTGRRDERRREDQTQGIRNQRVEDQRRKGENQEEPRKRTQKTQRRNLGNLLEIRREDWPIFEKETGVRPTSRRATAADPQAHQFHHALGRLQIVSLDSQCRDK